MMSAHPGVVSSAPPPPISSEIDREVLTPAPDTSMREPTGSFENLGDAFPRRVAVAVGVGDRTGVQREDAAWSFGGVSEGDAVRTGVVYLMLRPLEGAMSTSCHP